jgi:hypothetical protein
MPKELKPASDRWIEQAGSPHLATMSSIFPREATAVTGSIGDEKENTTIVNSAGKKADIEARIKQIKTEIEETTSDYEREKLQDRLQGLRQPTWTTNRRPSRGMVVTAKVSSRGETFFKKFSLGSALLHDLQKQRFANGTILAAGAAGP